MTTFQQMLDEAGVTFFRAAEFYSRKAKGAPRDVFPPPELWPNIIGAAKLANEIRRRYGKPLRASAYRDPHYNRLVGGGSASEHLEFRAIDLFPVGSYSQGDLARLKQIAREVVNGFDGRTGLGIYPGFVHVDTGALPPKGARRRWYGT